MITLHLRRSQFWRVKYLPMVLERARRATYHWRRTAELRHTPMILGYCRAPRSAAGLEAQKRRLTAMGAEQFFCENAGVFASKPELERAIEFAKKGDVIAVTRSYSVAHSTRGVLALIHRLGRKGVGLRILDTPVDTSTTTGRMILGSAPHWSLGLSPLRSALRDFCTGRRHQ